MVLAHTNHHLIKGLLKATPLGPAAHESGRVAARSRLNARHHHCSASLAKGSTQGCVSSQASIAAFRNAAVKWAALQPPPSPPAFVPTTLANSLVAAARLARPFYSLLRSLDFKPLLRGATSAFKGTTPAYHQGLSHSFRSAQRVVSQKFTRQAPATYQYAFARARPQLPASPLHGAGLQTARNFSSGGPTLAQVITNAPLILRAVGDELSDELKKSRKAPSAVTATKACSLNPRRLRDLGEQQRKKLGLQISGLSTARRNEVKLTTSIVAAGPSAQKHQQQQEGFDSYFPRVPTPTSAFAIEADKIITTIVVPIDPDIAGLIQGPPPASSVDECSLLGDGLWDEVQRRSDAYQRHRLRLISVFRLLDELMGVPPYLRDRQRSFHATSTSVREEDLEYMPETVHNVGYKYRLQGYTAAEVRESLIDRLGIETGAWFAQLIREEKLQSVALPAIALPHALLAEPVCQRHLQTGWRAGHASSQVDSWDDGQSLPSLPESVASLSVSSWDGVLYSPPSLRLSSAFESRLTLDVDDGGSHLQDSRVGW